MNWWHRLFGTPLPPARPIRAVVLELSGWREQEAHADMRVWRDEEGDALTVTSQPMPLPTLADSVSVQQWSRAIAEASHGGLIESSADPNVLGGSVRLIHKQLRLPAYLFTGMLFTRNPAFIWTVVGRERGTTGVREAVITAELLQAGRLTITDYEQSWAQDPYEPTYGGVDRSVLRFRSDDDAYDPRFPNHPLSKVRRVLAALPEAVHLS